MTLRRKILITFIAVLVLVGFQALVAVVLLTQLVDGTAQLVRPALTRVDAVAHLESDVLRLHALQHILLEGGSTAPDAALRQEADALRAAIDSRLQQYASQPLDERRLGMLETIRQEYYGSDMDDATFNTLDDHIHQLRHAEYDVIEQLREQLVGTAIWARWPLGVAVLVVGAAELALGWSLSRRIIGSLALLRTGARRIAQERWDQPIPPLPEPEFNVLATALNDMMVELAANRAEHTRLEADRLRLLRDHLAQVVEAQEQERARVSRELHDQAGQALTALKYGLDHVRRACPDSGARAEVDQLIELASSAGRQIGALARDLRPAVLDDLGLVAALRSYSREYADRVGISVDVSAPASLPRLGPAVETAIFRVVQEALTNIAKHARATRARVELVVKQPRLTVRVEDDGVGFDTTRLNGHTGLGLNGINERVGLLGGLCEVRSRPGVGTTITASIPLSASSVVGGADREPVLV